MATFDEQMRTLEVEGVEFRKELQKRARQFFEDFYPKLTPDEIREALELHTAFSKTEVEIIQVFYRTTSYIHTAAELQLGSHSPQAQVRHAVLRAIERVPEDSPLHMALQMAYKNRNIRQAGLNA